MFGCGKVGEESDSWQLLLLIRLDNVIYCIRLSGMQLGSLPLFICSWGRVDRLHRTFDTYAGFVHILDVPQGVQVRCWVASNY